MVFCNLRSLNIEDNFNNTFFDKVLPYTTAVATEFTSKDTSFFLKQQREEINLVNHHNDSETSSAKT